MIVYCSDSVELDVNVGGILMLMVVKLLVTNRLMHLFCSLYSVISKYKYRGNPHHTVKHSDQALAADELLSLAPLLVHVLPEARSAVAAQGVGLPVAHRTGVQTVGLGRQALSVEGVSAVGAVVGPGFTADPANLIAAVLVVLFDFPDGAGDQQGQGVVP